MTDITLRLEVSDDYREVENLTREAFWNVYEPGCSEHYLLNRMRQSPDFIPELDIVAVCKGLIVGSVACVRTYIEGDDNIRHTVVCLGPISVLPTYQRKGLARKMIEYVISTAGELGYKAIMLCGDPLLYRKYGFEEAGRYGIRTSDNKISPALHAYSLNGTDLSNFSGRYIENPVYEADITQVGLFDKNFPAKEKISDTPSQLRLQELLAMQTDFVKPRHIPRHNLNDCITPGLFVKKIGNDRHDSMKHYIHRDNYYLIAFITEGEAVVSVDFKEMTVRAGEAVIVSPEQIHAPVSASKKVDGWLMGIASEHFSAKEIELAAMYAINVNPIRLSDSVASDMKNLFDILSRNTDRYHTAVFIAQSIKSFVLFSLNADINSCNDRYLTIALNLKKLLASKLNEVKRPSYYAGMLNISEIYLNEAIKAVTGLSVSKFIRNQVVVRAKRQLAYTSLSAQEIAYDLGYDDYAYFSKLFKNETGLSPAQYRKTLISTSFS